MKSRHNTTQDQPIVNATDDTSDALLRACTLAPPVCIAADNPTANSGRGTMNARGSIKGGWRSMAIPVAFAAMLAVCISPALALALTCDSDICVNTTGWWRGGGAFNASGTPIHSAINDASTGNTITVADGTYNITGRIRVTEEVTITGNTGNPENVVVQYSNPATNLLIFDMHASNVTIEGVKTVNGKAGFWSDQSATGCKISHCIVDNTRESGILISNGDTYTIEYTTITNPGQGGDLSYSNGVHAGADNTTIDHCIITSDKVKHMKWGVNLEGGSNQVVTETTITGAWQAAIRVNSGVNPVTITNNDIDDATEGYQYEAAISLVGNNDGSTVSGNHIDDVVASSAIAASNAWNITIADNQIGVDDPSNDVRCEGIRVEGCGGSSANRVEVTGNTINNTGFSAILLVSASSNAYIYNNTITKCNNYGDDGSGDWDYASVHVNNASSNVIVDNNTISDGINGIQVWGSSCSVTNNTIYDMGLNYNDTKGTGDGTYYNSGIIVGTNWLTNNNKPTGTTITGNDIHNNYYGLYVRDYATLSPGDSAPLNVTAEYNYWGDATGADNASNPHGTGQGGDQASGTVDFIPWYATSTTTSGTQYVSVDHSGSSIIAYSNSIQGGINAALSGDTVNVADGTYTITAAITVDKGVTITGNTTTPENVVVQYSPASTSLNSFEIGAADITIQGFKIIDCFRGVHFGRGDVTSTGCAITNCVFDNIHENAIGEVAAENTTISNNAITNCTQQAIEIRLNEATSLANRTEVTGNTISSCSQSCIQTFGGKYVYIYNNTITSTDDKGINIIGSSATSSGERIQVVGNTISGTAENAIQLVHWGSYYPKYTYIHGNTISSSSDCGIWVAETFASSADERVEVSGNTISSTYYQGIAIDYSAPYTYVYNNTLTKCNYYGADGTGDWDYASIHVGEHEKVPGSGTSHYTVIDNNTISDGINGVQIWSNNCTVTNNTIYDMGSTYADTKGTAGVGDGVYYNSGIIIGSNWLTNNIKPTGTTITGNNIYGNVYGLYVRASTNNVSCNWVHDNTVGGFYLNGSTGNNISYNNIMFNGVPQGGDIYRWNFYNDQSDDVNATENFWGTNNETKINASIYDWQNDHNKGNVTFLPKLPEPDPCAPVPDVAALVLFASGLVLVSVCFVYGGRRKGDRGGESS